MNEDDFQLVLRAKRQIQREAAFALSRCRRCCGGLRFADIFTFMYPAVTVLFVSLVELRCHRQYGVGDQKGSHRRHRTAYPQRSRQSRPLLATEQTLRVSAKTSR